MGGLVPDISAAAEAVALARGVTTGAARQLADSEGGVDASQVVAYDLAHATAAVECARAAVDYGGRGEVEARLAAAFVADAVHDVAGRVVGEAASGRALRFAVEGRQVSDYHINVFYSEEDGGYVADVPDLEACSAFGASPEEALAEVAIAREAWLAAAREDGRAIPEPRYRPAIYTR